MTRSSYLGILLSFARGGMICSKPAAMAKARL
jgi:hypothetical protein